MTLREQAEDIARKSIEPAQAEVAKHLPEEMQFMLHDLRLHQIELELQNEELRRSQIQLGTANARFIDLYDNAPIGYCSLDTTGLILQANLTAANFLQVHRDSMLKHPLSKFIHKDDQDLYYFFRKRFSDTEESQACELRMLKPDGSHFWAGVEAALLINALGESEIRLMLHDITAEKDISARVNQLAYFDTLTSLPNRSQLEDRANHAIAVAQSNKTCFALMFLDIDNFKDINDVLGHSTGNALLIELARRFTNVMRKGDTVARLGGDEFILLVPCIDAKDAELTAQKMLGLVAATCEIDQHLLSVTGSIGIALFPNDGADLETLLRKADTAMYQVKRTGRRNFCFFTSEMEARSKRRLKLVNLLRGAIERDELSVHYQPQIDLHSGALAGVEALLRWKHADLGHVSPAEFIPLAEESGLISTIGEWVLRQALKQFRVWQNKGTAVPIIAVNISALQFRHPDLPLQIERILAEEGVKPEHLELELTESAVMLNPEKAIAMMRRLNARGVRFAIDDFGTGYSSLAILKKFKAHRLKIDRSFVHDISHNAESRSIVLAIIQMAKSMGLSTIAEGVETTEEMAFLREQGCDEIQGFLFSKAVPADEIESLSNSIAGILKRDKVAEK